MAEPLDPVHLRSLVAIADCGGFHRAAAALRLSQSTISGHVRQLERWMKAPLVEKSGRGSRFTIAGDALLTEARRILAVHDAAAARLEVDGRATVLVGCTEHTADQLLPDLLQVLRTACPDQAVRFRLDRSTQLSDAVSRGVLDLAVVLGVGPGEGVSLGSLPLRWLAADAADVRPEAGELLPLVAFEEPCGLRRRALATLTAAGLRPVVAAESTTLEGVIAAARAGLGVALLPNLGSPPAHLVAPAGLPAVADADLRLVVRRGVDPGLEEAARRVVSEFFARIPWGPAGDVLPRIAAAC